MDINEVQAFLERLDEPLRWEAHDARCGLHAEGERPLVGWIYTNPEIGAGYFARTVKRKTHRRVIERLPEGYPMVPVHPGSRTMLRAPGIPVQGWFETTCPKPLVDDDGVVQSRHVIGADAEALTNLGRFETVYLAKRSGSPD